jgi:CO dehydrogenase maturation factor
MGLKLAIGGKGGVGKTTVAALLARYFARTGNQVIAIDADPVSNLAAALGIDEREPITPIAELADLIEERTGAKPGTMGGFFTLNPKVDDIPERFSRQCDGVRLLVMGTVQNGGGGCICPESTVLKTLMTHLVLQREDILIMDMEAGVEHLGRGTSGSVDALVIVVNPGLRSMHAADKIRKLGTELGIRRTVVLGNRVDDAADEELIRTTLSDFEIIGCLPELAEINRADRTGARPFADISGAPPQLAEIGGALAHLA